MNYEFEVEEWVDWEYPSHWDYCAGFDTLEKAKEFVNSQKHRGRYRIIQEIPID